MALSESSLSLCKNDSGSKQRDKGASIVAVGTVYGDFSQGAAALHNLMPAVRDALNFFRWIQCRTQIVGALLVLLNFLSCKTKPVNQLHGRRNPYE
jgi:hypothetical protein